MADSPISHSQRLRHKVQLVLPELMAAAHAFRAHPHIRDLYPRYLFTTYSVMRATVPVMQAALERARSLAAADPVAAAMVPYLTKHIPEEMHAFWPLEDLEVLGFERSDVITRQPSPAVAAMVGAQYYWIFHAHPVAIFGYMEIMEGYPPTEEHVEELIEQTGYPRAAFRTMSNHSLLDVGHRDELRETLDRLPLTRAQSSLIGVSALQSVQLGSRVIWETIERA